MTRAEAIKNIKEHCYFANLVPQAKEALDMAVEALEQDSKVGHWDKVFVPLPLSDGTKECYQCSSCGTHWEYTSKYCPYCRAIMGSEEE